MKKIWQKTSTQTQSEISEAVENFTVGRDYLLDDQLLPFDIAASLSHAKMLGEIGILTREEVQSLEKGLSEILKLWKKGEFEILKSDEDCHTAIEKYLTENYGEVGKKIHTGRSRNDQILVATRLLQKDKLCVLEDKTRVLLNTFALKTEQIGDLKMPGYTHMQRAMPSSVGMWLGSFESSFVDDLAILKTTKKVIDQNPLGSAAGFGESVLGLDREYTTKDLGFAKTQENPMYCAYSRGKFELLILQSLSNFMLDFGKLANDLLLFTTSEFGFFKLPDEFLTGSSIMPQKKNYDVLELLRAKVSIFFGYETQIQGVIKNLPSGYNRDFQMIKEPFLAGLDIFEECLNMLTLVVDNLQANKKNLQKACTEELYATDEAYKLVKSGMSFREAYKEIGKKYL